MRLRLSAGGKDGWKGKHQLKLAETGHLLARGTWDSKVRKTAAEIFFSKEFY